MNFIIDRHLDPTERQLLYELTLKKRRSKKSTMSEKQVLARQQLARELMQERRVPSLLDYPAHSQWSLRHCSINSSSSINTTTDSLTTTDDQASLYEQTLTSIATNLSHGQHQHHSSPVKLHSSESSAQADNSRSFNGSCGCSFSRSDSSYSGSSQVSRAVAAEQQQQQQQQDSNSSRYSRQLEKHDKELLVKMNKSRLDHLNTELERRLYQYEYLVAQEKDLLGTFNMMLFTNEGVNNFAY